MFQIFQNFIISFLSYDFNLILVSTIFGVALISLIFDKVVRSR